MCGISTILTLGNSASKHKSTRQSYITNGVSRDATHKIEGVELNGDSDHNAIAYGLDASLGQIKHRGPDSRGQWISKDKRIALGHVRLSINDLSTDGTQPFHSKDRRIHAVVNGELYDYDNIRTHLAIVYPSYHFHSRSDSELVIALYKFYGIDFIRHLRGEFAIALFDEDQQLFIALRDRYGIKPLFWTVQDGRLLVASEVKAFLPLGWKHREWDVRSLMDGGWSNDTRTVFKGVQKIRPGHYLSCQSFGHVEQRQYWDISYPDKHHVDPRTPEELINGVRERLLDSIRLRLRADVPVGIYLSGGIDSSVIAGMATHLIRSTPGLSMGSADPSSRITCFSIAFDEESGFDESAIANRTAEWLGVKYIKKLMDESGLADRFEAATWHAEHTNPDLNYIGKFALSEVPQQEGYKVVLTGEGADENFGGYPVFLPDYLREQDHWAHNPLPSQYRDSELVKAEAAAQEYYRSVGANSNNKSGVSTRILNNISTPASMSAFQLDIFAQWTNCYGTSDMRMTIANNVDGRVRDFIREHWHPLHSAQYVWSKGHLANIFLTCLGDRTEMAHSIEARTPFLDHKFTEYVNHLPPSAKIHWQAAHNPDANDATGQEEEGRFIEKWVLREAAKPFITEELYQRKKHPYSAPTSWPTDGPLHSLFKKLVTEHNIKQLGFVDWKRCKGVVDRAFGNDEKDVAVKAMAMRYAIVIAQWVVLAQRFGLETARLAEVS